MAQTKFDIKTEVTRPLYAYVGVTDRAVEAVRESVVDLQKLFTEVQKDVQSRVQSVSKSVQELDLEPKALRAELEERFRKLLRENEAAYDQLVVRGETLVERIRHQQSTQDAVDAMETSSAKAKTTATQVTEASKATAKTAQEAAKTTTATARKRSTAPQSSAKATATTAKRAAKSAGKATAQGAKKVGD